jgi:plastocyanin domain-containing protein
MSLQAFFFKEFKMQKLLIGLLTISSMSPALARETKGSQKIAIEVTEKGFAPSSIEVTSGTDVTLEVTRKTDETCSKEIQVPSKNIRKDLPLNQTVTIALGTLKSGEIRFGCGMDMMDAGKILVR